MNEFLDEKQEIVNLRRYKNALGICGKGTLVLVLWSLVRFLMQVTMDGGAEFVYEFASVESDEIIMFWFVFAATALVVLFVHAFAAFSAMAEAKGKKKGFIYLAVYIVLIISSIDSLAGLINGTTGYGLLESILMFMLELMSIVVEAGAIINSVKIKKIKKLLKEEVK